MRTYDVAIIGAGSAGLSALKEVQKKTESYIVIDDGPLGTTCARVGCMPSKAFIQVANDFHRRHKFAQIGIHGAEKLSVDTSEVMKHVRVLRDRFAGGVERGMQAWEKAHLLRERATFIDQNTLQVGKEKIRAERIIIATGSKPIWPEKWREFKDYIVDTDQFFELEKLPKKMAVIGLGVIGVELGQALSRLGVEIIGISLEKVIGGLSDPAIQNYTFNTLNEEFKIILSPAEILGVKNNQLEIKAGNEVFYVEKALVALGRAPQIKNLGLEKIGLQLDARGMPTFDKSTFRIQNSPLYIVGDVNGERPILHEASDEGRIAGYNSVRSEDQCFVRREFMSITFSSPQIVIVGKSFKELQASKENFVVGEVSFEGQGRALTSLSNKGLAHIYADKHSGRLLGAEMMAPQAEHFAHLLAWVMSYHKNVYDVLSLPFYHPVLEEGLRTAFRDLSEKIEFSPPPLEVLRCQDNALMLQKA
ncbi:MAG: dihydrolipoyl dehydrogenase [Oligoflexales bacterium]|nr:dihydrolipoyl dehydrogenase [Oligoflexales bacterium]